MPIPPRPSPTRRATQTESRPAYGGAGSVALYMMDLTDGGVTLIADQPRTGPDLLRLAGLVARRSSHLFDATPGTQWGLTRLISIGPGEGGRP